MTTFNTVPVHRDHVEPVSEIPPPNKRNTNNHQPLPPAPRDLPIHPLDELPELDWDGVYKVRVPAEATDVSVRVPAPSTPDRNRFSTSTSATLSENDVKPI